MQTCSLPHPRVSLDLPLERHGLRVLNGAAVNLRKVFQVNGTELYTVQYIYMILRFQIMCQYYSAAKTQVYLGRHRLDSEITVPPPLFWRPEAA